MNRILLSLFTALAAACFVPSCQTAPPIGFEDTPEVQLQRTDLYEQLLSLLPEEQQKLPAARAEARRLADVSYKAAAAIGRINQPRRWPAWRNNVLVNSLSDSALERGLCWHYQHDMYRELRRLNLQFFNIGCCVYKKGTGREHNCIYLTPVDNAWPQAVILDAWRLGGRLLFIPKDDIDTEDWQDRANSTEWLADVYPVGHQYPIEHWATVRDDKDWNLHHPSYTAAGQNTKQGKRMYDNMRRGLRERNGKATTY